MNTAEGEWKLGNSMFKYVLVIQPSKMIERESECERGG